MGNHQDRSWPPANATYKSKIGMAARSTAAAADLDGADLDVIVIPGGYAPDRMRRDPSMVDLVRDANAAGKLTAFICYAGCLPISAGILEGKKVTGFYSIKDDLVNAGAEYVDQSVVRDVTMITLRTTADLPDFCRTIVEALAEKESGNWGWWNPQLSDSDRPVGAMICGGTTGAKDRSLRETGAPGLFGG